MIVFTVHALLLLFHWGVTVIGLACLLSLLRVDCLSSQRLLLAFRVPVMARVSLSLLLPHFPHHLSAFNNLPSIYL